jgi:hypothetical protein
MVIVVVAFFLLFCVSFYSLHIFFSCVAVFFLLLFFENYVLEMCSLLFPLYACLLDFTGESKYDENWKELTKMLNNTLGPKKTVEEWKMVNE